MDYIIGVDIGTTSTKTVLFNLKGEAQANANISYPLYQDAPEMAEQDPEEIFAAVVKGLATVMKQGAVQADELRGVSFSAAMHSLILMDENGQPLTRVITWADNRAAAVAEQLKDNGIGQELFQNTGVPTHPMSPLIKLIWLQETQPELMAATRHIVGIKEYVLHRLFGEYVMDYSLANATGLFDIHTMDWNEQALMLTGIKREQLPRLVDTEAQLTGLNPEFAKATGIPADTPFIVGASDGTLSNLGLSALDPGALAVTIGTSGAVRCVVDRPMVDPHGALFTYYLAKNRWVVGGPVNNGGIVLRWVSEQLFSQKKETVGPSAKNSYDDLMQLASDSPAGAYGLLFHPYLGGERAPLWDANARGSYFGLTRQHTRAHMMRATLEGIIFNLYSVAQKIEELAGRPTRILATGGFARSPLWRQILADIFEQDVIIPESFESSALGAAVLAMHSLGLIDDLNDVKNMVGVTTTHHPNPENAAIYRVLFPIWQRLSQTLSNEYDSISGFQRAHPEISISDCKD